jgi:heterotetrameric sarcosine oxidase gamma subunit
MMPPAGEPVREWRVARLPPTRVLEVVAFRPVPANAGAVLPSSPGEVLRDAEGAPALLHFAPGRWLVPASGLDLATALAGVPAFGAIVDVTGKWQELAITGKDAPWFLASAVAIDAVLDGRQCAAVTLFDCPAIVARGAGGFVVWLPASYVAHFLALAQGHGAASPRK